MYIQYLGLLIFVVLVQGCGVRSPLSRACRGLSVGGQDPGGWKKENGGGKMRMGEKTDNAGHS